MLFCNCNKIDDELIADAKKGCRLAISRIIAAMENYTAKIAAYYCNKLSYGESYYDDFAQEARIAILHSLDSYEIGKGDFCKYTEYAMRISVRKFINDSYRLIRQPKGKIEKVTKLNKVLAHFAMVEYYHLQMKLLWKRLDSQKLS